MSNEAARFWAKVQKGIVNETAERLRGLIERWSSPATARSLKAALDKALADERRATWNRVNEVLDGFAVVRGAQTWDELRRAILDAEAER